MFYADGNEIKFYRELNVYTQPYTCRFLSKVFLVKKKLKVESKNFELYILQLDNRLYHIKQNIT